MNFLSFAGSLRTKSLNKKLAQEAVRLLSRPHIGKVEFIDLRHFPMSLYDGDQEDTDGIPDTVVLFARKIIQSDALIIATPEYNGGMSSTLKNALDWLSRVKPLPLAGKHLLLLCASPGAWGGVRGLWHSRVPFEALGVHVFPHMFSLPNAGSAFDETGRLRKDSAERLQELLSSFADHVDARITLKAA